MRIQLDEMDLVLKKHNISAPASTRKDESEEEDEEYKRKGHALKASCSSAHDFLIDSGASNHMVAPKESLYSLQYFDGPSIQLENNSKFSNQSEGLYQY